MKRFASILLVMLTLSACSWNREQTLKVYNWSNYIGEGVIEDFENWYEEQTGEPVHVVYQTFDINETMLSKIEMGHEDFDISCPSDYIIEKMLNSDLILPLDFSVIPDSINYIQNNRSPYMKDIFSKINPSKDANDYAVPFMWGTTGLIYNPKYVSDEEASSWECLNSPKFKGKILMKDAPRDVFSPILIYLKQQELRDSLVTLDALMQDSSDSSVALVENFLNQMRDGVLGWEADFGKEQMTQERAWLSLNWSGDAVWAIEEAAEMDIELRYAVPNEGSSVWFDGWVIPKYAKNIKAATLFIDFMCRPDIAIRNMEETGYVSANGDISVLESQIDTTLDALDLSYFFPGQTEVQVDPALYPDMSMIQKCTLMHDWGEDTEKLIAMWSRVKGNTANTFTIIIISVFFALLLAAGVYKKFFSKSHRRKRR